MRQGLLIVILAFGALQGWAQQSILADSGDQLQLNADAYEGSIQWQLSMDDNTWTDIENETQGNLEYLLSEFPVYFRAAITREGCAVHYSETIAAVDIHSTTPLLWSDSDTWGGAGKPGEGDVVTIPAGTRIILDDNPPALGGLVIEGKLEFDRKDLSLTSDYIMVHGFLEIGTETSLFEHKAIITLTGDSEQDIASMGSRGIMVMGGSLELHGASPEVVWTRLNDHANAGSTNVMLSENVSWAPGDEVVVAPTDFYRAGNGISITEKMTVESSTSDQLEFTNSLNASHWGLLQYATATGMSLTNTNLVNPPVADTDSTTTPLVLDERAEVGNLTRNIVIQSVADDLWSNIGFGAHVMIMGPSSTAHVEGVEFKRAGQRGNLGRYPFHWHMLSYSGSETLEDATGQYLRNSSINTSKNRGIVIHGTNGVLVENNIVYDVQGHGVFTEDAVERRNKILNNLVLHVRNPPFGRELKQHETGELGSSGFWISNPDNELSGNVAADCGTFGFWMAFTTRPWGLSSSVLAEDGQLINPSRTLFGIFENNTAHSNQLHGIMLDNVEVAEDGTTGGHQYWSTTTGREGQWPFPNLRRFSLARYKVWKNGANGIWDRAVWADNFEVVSADNCGRFFAGSGSDGVIERSLVIGTSLNHEMNGTGRPELADFQGGFNTSTPAAFATYHSTFDIQNNIVINFQSIDGHRSGAFSTDDYYTRAVDKGQVRNANNLLINSHPGVKLQAPYGYFTLASALWDPYGMWGPEDNYFVYDNPFLTHGKEVTSVAPGGGSGGVSVPGPFYGFRGFVLHGIGDEAPKNQPFMDMMGIHIRRLDESLEEVATWTVPEAQPQWALQHMRDFATTPEGIYELTFPEEEDLPTHFQMYVDNMLSAEDQQVMAIQYDGSLDPIVLMAAYQHYEVYSEVGSLQEVTNSAGATWWQDKANNFIWVKIRGGLWKFWTTNEAEAVPSSDDLLYETTELRIYVN
ncbi:MAG: G8 domain-containing protein [Marinoscillum sp.]